MQLTAITSAPGAATGASDARGASGASLVSAASSLRATLAAATAALLAPGLVAAQTTSAAQWQVDSAVLVYQEGGGRVRAVEPVISARRTDGNDRTVGLKLTLDALTGASPNGAAPQPTAQTFTSPSGDSRYTTPAGKSPLDPNFRDRRVALAGTLERPWGTAQRLSLAANVSSETDFKSLSLSAGLARDFNQKNTTLSLTLALEADRIEAQGGVPTGLRPLRAGGDGDGGGRGGDDDDDRDDDEHEGGASRTVADVLLGVTQVINRHWLMQTNIGYGRSSGNHDDPYKILSVVDGSTGLLVGDRYVSESRPDSRSRLSVYWQNKLHLTQDVVDLSYRFYRDDWGVRAHTLDLRYRLELGAGLYLEPHLRLHQQSKADFSQGWLVEGQGWNSSTQTANVANASADPRLAAFTAQTLGAKFGMPLGRGGELTARLEFYRQTPKALAGAPGALRTLELTPTLKATTVMLGYSLPW